MNSSPLCYEYTLYHEPSEFRVEHEFTEFTLQNRTWSSTEIDFQSPFHLISFA